MAKPFKSDSADYCSLIINELTHDREKNIQMLQELRKRNQGNGKLVREIDCWLLLLLTGDRKEGFVARVFHEVREGNREALKTIAKGLRKVVPEENARDIQLEPSTGGYGKDRVSVIQTARSVILVLDHPQSEFLNFCIDYFRSDPHGFEVSEIKGEKICIYRWEKESMEHFRAVPDEIDHLFTFGSALMEHGLHSYAASRFQEILNRDPGDHETLLRLSQCLIATGHTEFAFHPLRTAVSIKPGDGRAYRALADCFHEFGLYGTALENLLHAKELGEEDREIYNNIGFSYAQQEDHDRAVEAYKKALEFDPGSALTWRNIGLAYQRLGRIDQAIEAYEKCSELDPRNQEPHLLLGGLCEEVGDLSRSIEAYQKAVQIRPDYSAYLSMGRAYEKLGRMPDARASYQEALRIDPTGREARAKLFWLDHPDMEDLEEEMAQVVREHPFLEDDPDAVPVIYEEAKRRMVEREGAQAPSEQGQGMLGPN